MISPPLSSFERYLALDLHRDYVVAGAVNGRQEIVLPPRRIEWTQWDTWRQANLRPTDAVVLEATTNAWPVYDQVAPLVGRAVVAHPALVKLIANARVKTDPRDVLHLARLLAANWVPEVWVPPVTVRELRSLLAHRQRLIQQRTRTRNRLHSVLHRHNLKPPAGDPFHPDHQVWWQALPISPTECLRVRQDWASLVHFGQQLDEVELEVERLSGTEVWAPRVPFLLQLPGFGLLTAMTVLAAVGDISRFPTAKQLVGYAGLGAGVHRSGQTDHGGHITKQGRSELRWVLVEAAWSAVRWHPHWQAEFERLARRRGERRAIVAIARKLLVLAWHVLTEQVADRHAQPEKVAYKLLRWTWRLPHEQRGGLTAGQLVRCQLLKLQLGDTLTELNTGGKKRRLPSAEEVRHLKGGPLASAA
jgi:transposase